MLLGGNLVVIASEQDLLSEKTSINQADVVECATVEGLMGVCVLRKHHRRVSARLMQVRRCRRLKASSQHATSEALVGSGLSRDARQTPRAATQEAGLALQSVW